LDLDLEKESAGQLFEKLLPSSFGGALACGPQLLLYVIAYELKKLL
jgi:hypothetical protein